MNVQKASEKIVVNTAIALQACVEAFSNGMFESVSITVEQHPTRILRSGDRNLLNRKL